MRVLIVEDDPALGPLLAQFCQEFLGPQLESVRVAAEFVEASALVDELPIDLLLLDLNLQGCDGMELLTRSVAGSFHTIIVSGSESRPILKPAAPDESQRTMA